MCDSFTPCFLILQYSVILLLILQFSVIINVTEFCNITLSCNITVFSNLLDCKIMSGSFTLAMHVPPHDKTLENHITFPKESEIPPCQHVNIVVSIVNALNIRYTTTNALKHLTDQDLSQNWVGLDRKKLANKHIRIMPYSPSGRLVVKILVAQS